MARPKIATMMDDLAKPFKGMNQKKLKQFSSIMGIISSMAETMDTAIKSSGNKKSVAGLPAVYQAPGMPTAKGNRQVATTGNRDLVAPLMNSWTETLEVMEQDWHNAWKNSPKVWGEGLSEALMNLRPPEDKPGLLKRGGMKALKYGEKAANSALAQSTADAILGPFGKHGKMLVSFFRSSIKEFFVKRKEKKEKEKERKFFEERAQAQLDVATNILKAVGPNSPTSEYWANQINLLQEIRDKEIFRSRTEEDISKVLGDQYKLEKKDSKYLKKIDKYTGESASATKVGLFTKLFDVMGSLAGKGIDLAKSIGGAVWDAIKGVGELIAGALTGAAFAGALGTALTAALTAVPLLGLGAAALIGKAIFDASREVNLKEEKNQREFEKISNKPESREENAVRRGLTLKETNSAQMVQRADKLLDNLTANGGFNKQNGDDLKELIKQTTKDPSPELLTNIADSSKKTVEEIQNLNETLKKKPMAGNSRAVNLFPNTGGSSNKAGTSSEAAMLGVHQ